MTMKILLLLCLALPAFAGPAQYPKRDILWRIVSNCLEDVPDRAAYCRDCPSPLENLLPVCAGSPVLNAEAACRRSTQVWVKTSRFVAIRDRKMCGCPESFVHGLALPLSKVSGAEDPARPTGIWRFAWDEALKKIVDKESVILAANPRIRRTQDQLHIHIVRLADGARERFLAFKPLRVKNLKDVWGVAAQHAASTGLLEGGYGVGVIAAPGGGWQVAASSESLESMFSAYSCVLQPAWKPGERDR